MKTLFLAAGLILLVIFIFDIGGEVKRPPGVLVSEEPSQLLVSGPSWRIGRDRFNALARFRMRARVLRTERYWMGIESRFSPVDIAVGWGPMSDQRILDQLYLSQGRRFLEYRPKGRSFPIPFAEMNSHSANMHMIPADKEVRKLLRVVRRGNIIDLDGYLVEVDPKEGGKWRSSLSRTDSGGGACEIVWVERLSIN
jgi:hypothetical protein